ncbi:MAG: hypothetical protein HYX78_07740 [Armatimonadetes bacterium]|nr:hypothetical protein [Armatimonadota bacterium]
MTKSTLVLFSVLVGVLLLGTVPARAQLGDERPAKFGLKLIAFFPRDNEIRDIESTWLGVGFDYYLKRDEDGKPTRYVTLGLLNSGDGFFKANQDPLTYTILRRRNISPKRSSYKGFGAGAYRLRVKLARAGRLVDDSTYMVGVHAIYGQEFYGSYFVELRVDYIPRWKDVDWGGISLNIGTKVSFN